MELKAAVEKYLEVVREFRRPMPLSGFGLPPRELEALLSAWDEDYHLHRHFELLTSAEAPPGISQDAPVYLVGGQTYVAIVIHESIRHVLDQTSE